MTTAAAQFSPTDIVSSAVCVPDPLLSTLNSGSIVMCRSVEPELPELKRVSPVKPDPTALKSANFPSRPNAPIAR